MFFRDVCPMTLYYNAHINIIKYFSASVYTL